METAAQDGRLIARAVKDGDNFWNDRAEAVIDSIWRHQATADFLAEQAGKVAMRNSEQRLASDALKHGLERVGDTIPWFEWQLIQVG